MKPLPKLADYNVPETKDIENKLIATILADASDLTEVMRFVKEDMFSTSESKKIWNAVVNMYYNHEPINLMSVMPKVDRTYFIDNILSQVPEYGVGGARSLMVALMETYVKRQAYFGAVNILTKIENGSANSEITTIFDSFSDNIAKGLDDGNTKTATEICNELAEDLQKGDSGKIPTTIRSLDFFTYGGFGGGNLVILAARPSVGKTTIAMQMAVNASKIGRKATFFSLEMSGKDLVKRMILSTGYVSPFDLHNGNLDWANYERAAQEVINPNLTINDKAKSIDELCTKITIMHQQGKCDIAFIDYLGLIPMTNSRMGVVQQIGMFTQKLKGVAKECDIPIVLLCQLSRSSVSEVRSPQLHDLRDSGSIEQDADIVLMLEHARQEDGATIEGDIWLWIRKNRSGRRNFDNPIVLRGDSSYNNFQEIEQ